MSFETIPLDDFATVFGSASTEISSAALNGHVVSVSDEFFAGASQLLEVGPALSLKGQFGPKGALYSGWESRRHNPTYDWCIIRLGVPSGHILGFDIDTSNFSGNEAPQASVDGFHAEPGNVPPKVDDEWEELLPKANLGPSSRHLFRIPQTNRAYTHVKLNMFPDGGIARFRVYGLVSPVFPEDVFVPLDLAHVYSGGRVVAVSDQHYGVGANLLLPGRGKDMGDGWETKRSRTPGHNDWVIIKLGAPGALEQAEIDTANFIGNFPESCEIHALLSSEHIPDLRDRAWKIILSRTKLGPHRRHFFPLEGAKDALYSHVKVTIYPDGGIKVDVKRIRVIGRRSVGGGDETTAVSSAQPTPSHKQLPSIPTTPSIALTTSTFSTLAAVPLTREAFIPFGDVIQAWATPLAAPRDIRVTTANQGTATKYHSLSTVASSYPDAAREAAGVPKVGVFRSTPPAELPAGTKTWPVKLLERHKHTNQIFIPMGNGVVPGAEEDAISTPGHAYLVIVAQNGPDDKPDLATMRAFVAGTSQGIAYGTGIWHHPMIPLERPIDFTCVETQVGTPDNILDCEIVEINAGDGSVPTVRIPEI
ncbi:hypothetical protein BS47DRAFT_1390130 [Hydnum rufescens UP504]|uniref:Allantoicase domain-containing protein n=1 Tax=Hydnum rufescens UP504 TaxID=1448309 RepID=A0A9P6B3V4_9AGAM|nr:hypothetical protein BS47DRAFT_1390130 [Hydnum rufescens UP504]